MDETTLEAGKFAGDMEVSPAAPQKKAHPQNIDREADIVVLVPGDSERSTLGFAESAERPDWACRMGDFEWDRNVENEIRNLYILS